MKKSLIGVLALGLVIGAGTMGATSFASEKEYSNNVNPGVAYTDQSNLTQGDSEFKVLNQESNKLEKTDDSQYRNSNSNYRNCCPYSNYENGNIN